MSRSITTSVALLIASALLASVAQAGSVTTVIVNNGGGTDSQPSNLAGTTTNDVLINAGPTEQINTIQIYAELSEGSFFNAPAGSNTPPQVAFFPLWPNLAFDTFVASGVANNIRGPAIAGASVDLGSPNSGGPVTFDSNTVDVTFGPEPGQNTLGAINFLVARLTIGSEGIFRMDVEFSGGGPHATYLNGSIRNGVIQLVPEPASSALAGFAACGVHALLSRRKLRQK